VKKDSKDMLIYRILAAIMRCGHRIRACAAICIQDLASTLKGYYRDKTLGNIDTSYSYSDSFTQGKHRDSVEYIPSGYTAITAMLRHLRLTEDDVFVDFGCGKGRVIFSVATHRLKKVIGIEVDKTLVDIARTNLTNITQLNINSTPVEILHLDATTFDPKEGTIFYMFNPFEYKTMQQVLNNIKTSLITHPRDIRIVYNNPKHRVVLDMQDWLVAEGEIDNSLVYVWRNRLALQTHSTAGIESVLGEL
jgi:SAM-dependent methyltransferase